MKKILAFAATALLAVSCVVNNYDGTPSYGYSYLEDITNEIVMSTAFSSVSAMVAWSEENEENKENGMPIEFESINSQGFKLNYAHEVLNETMAIDITRTGNWTWFVSGASKTLSFSMTLSNDFGAEKAKWTILNYNAFYDEKSGYSMYVDAGSPVEIGWIYYNNSYGPRWQLTMQSGTFDFATFSEVGGNQDYVPGKGYVCDTGAITYVYGAWSREN